MSSMSAAAGDGEPGTSLDTTNEEISGPACTGENNKQVSSRPRWEHGLRHIQILVIP